MEDKLFSRLVEHSLNHDSHHSLIASKKQNLSHFKGLNHQKLSDFETEEASIVANETVELMKMLFVSFERYTKKF